MKLMRIFCYCALLLLGGCTTVTPPAALTWDLTTGHDITTVGWQPDHTSSVYHLSDVEITVELPNSIRVLPWNASNVYVQRRITDPDQIELLSLHSQKMTLDTIYTEALQRATALDLPTKPIEEWYASGGESHFLSVNPLENDPSLSLKSTPSFNDQEPWILALDIFYP